jgi:hypothetical protein
MRFALPRLPLALAAATLVGTLSAAANATTVDFGSISQQAANGVTLDGVTFGYTEFGSASPEAQVGVDVGPGVAQSIQGSALVGPTDGLLTLSFASPVQQISFGIAETTDLTLAPGFTVSVFDAAGHILQTSNVNTSSLVLFSEGDFNYDGGAASSLVISFDATDANEFVLGPVTYTTASSTPVPEPANIGIFAVALIGLGATIMRRREG